MAGPSTLGGNSGTSALRHADYLQERTKPPETDRPPGALIAPELPRELLHEVPTIGQHWLLAEGK